MKFLQSVLKECVFFDVYVCLVRLIKVSGLFVQIVLGFIEVGGIYVVVYIVLLFVFFIFVFYFVVVVVIIGIVIIELGL